jgi:hypothetical protein
METDIKYSPSSRTFEREMTASAEQWSNWTTNEIRSAIEAEREQTFELLAELLVRIQKDVIPEVVGTLPALRGPTGPVGPAGKLPIAKEWQREKVYYEGEVATYDGATYQALRDTGEPPDNEAHWICLAAPGRDAKSFHHRGTFKDDAEYASHDIVALNGGSFLALHDKPGLCPGPGWHRGGASDLGEGSDRDERRGTRHLAVGFLLIGPPCERPRAIRFACPSGQQEEAPPDGVHCYRRICGTWLRAVRFALRSCFSVALASAALR